MSNENTKTHTVLIVEDEPSIRLLYQTKLEGGGFIVETANNGHEGLIKAEQVRPDLILLDLRMPVVSGDEMLEQLRDTEWGEHMDVIILTNISKDEAPISLRHLKVKGYAVKVHHTPSQILDMVKDVIATKR